ncbi:MAG: hypothetical protein ASARMPREDX12_007881 [Alectoria sarmentosa]|nr:MAG: hypothetical protein ASARMPREDX12_007881 [Alectoria sarmentosa]
MNASNVYQTQTLSDVTGEPFGISQTHTTDKNVSLVSGSLPPGAVPPPPPGFSPVDIVDGLAELAEDDEGSEPEERPEGGGKSSSPFAEPNSISNSRSVSGSFSGSIRTRSTITSALTSPTGSLDHTSGTTLSANASQSILSSATATSWTTAQSVSPNVTISSNATNATAYIIYPSDGGSNANSVLTSELQKLFGENLYICENEYIGLLYWRVPLMAAQVATYQLNPAVSAVVQDEIFAMDDNADPDPGPSISVLSASPVPQRKRDTQKKEWVLEARGNVQSDPYASWDLVKLSLPPGKSPLLNDYYYDDSLGQGSTIYIFDTGADPSSKDYQSNTGTKRWIILDNGRLNTPWGSPSVGPAEGDIFGITTLSLVESQSCTSGHGQQMFSKAAGGHNGVARKANLVFVRWPLGLFLVPRFEYDHQVSAALFIDGLARILKDVNDNNLQGKAVINMSFGFPLGTVMNPQIETMAELMRRLEASGVVLVVAAGNYAQEVLPGTGTLRTETDIYPALMARDAPDLNLIIVSAIGPTGQIAPFSQRGPLTSVYAPGINVQIESRLQKGAIATSQLTSGTSVSAAMEQVGGVILNAMETLGTKGKAVVSGLHLECKSDDTDLRLSPLIVPALKAAYLPGGTNLTNPNNSTLNSSKSSTNEDSILELITPNQITHIGQPKAHISTDTSPPLSSQSSTPDNPNDSLCRQASDGDGGWICADRQPGSRFKS